MVVLAIVVALPGATESTVVTVYPTRVLDTRSNIGVIGKVVAGAPEKLMVTGTINTWIEANQQSISRVVVPECHQLVRGLFLCGPVTQPVCPQQRD